MPTYDFACQSCGKQEETFMRVSEYKRPNCCGKEMQPVLRYNVVPDLEPYVDENIGTDPVLVKSKRHRRQLMKEHGVTEKFGKGWW